MLFKLYLSKLNTKINALWQKPRQGTVNYCDPDWFEPRVIGRDMLERFMKLSLHKSLKLDGTYTNHSIRATVISTLDRAGFEARHIIALSSHKNESTIKDYATKCPENKRKEMFDSLSNAMLPTVKKSKHPTSTVTKAIADGQTGQENPIDNLATFDLDPINDFETLDDNLLANLIYDNPTLTKGSDKENATANINSPDAIVPKMPQNMVPLAPTTTSANPQINTQVINHNVPTKNVNFPRLPPMYFPNSNVTINYNFGN